MTDRELYFCQLVATLFNGSEAYRRAFNVNPETTGYGSVNRRAYELMRRPDIAEQVAAYRKGVADKFELDSTELLSELIDIVRADPNDLVQHRHDNCRHCYGVDFKYQWRDVEEWGRAIATLMDAADPKKDPPALPDNLGGFGFRADRLPNESCPRCDGEGVHRVVIADTSKLQGPARKLYAGVKQTKNGIEVLMHDKGAAMDKLLRCAGAYKDSLDVKAKLAAALVPAVPMTEEQRAALDGFFDSNY